MAGQQGDGTIATFVTNLYRELLGREPDAAGFSYWMAQASNGDRAAVVRGFLASPEYATHYVTTLYENFMHRAVDPVGMQYFTAVLQSSRDELQVLSYILGSAEYFAANGSSNAGFITALYRDLVGRAPDAGGQAYWTALADQGMARNALVMSFLLTTEGRNKLINANYLQPVTTPNAPPGSPQPGAYGLATATGNGLGNLYFQGNYNANALDAALAEIASDERSMKNDEDAIVSLLSSNQYFDNTGANGTS